MDTQQDAQQPAIRTLRNGTRVGPNGKFLSGPSQDAPGVITTQNARTLAQARWDKQRAAFAAGMIQAIKSTGMMPDGATGEAGAWQAIAERATTVMLDEQDAGRLARLLKTSADLAGYSQPKAQDQPQDGASGLFSAVPPGGLLVLARRLSDDDSNAFDNCTYPNHDTEDDTIDTTADDADHPTP